MDGDLIAALTAALLISLVAGIYGYSKGAGNICASYGLEYTDGKCTNLQERYREQVYTRALEVKSREASSKGSDEGH